MLRRFGSFLLAASLCTTPGCFAYKDVKRDRDERPVVMTGVSGSILYPGQSPGSLPTLPPPTSGASASQRPGATSGSRRAAGGAGMPSAGEPVFIGGNDTSIDQHYREHREPKWYNPFWFPFAVILFPIRAAREVVNYVRGEPAAPPPQGQPLSPNAPYSQREDLQRAYERARLETLERQLAEQRTRAGAPAPAARAAARRSGTPSIEEELAALRAGASVGVPLASTAAPVAGHAAPAARGAAPSSPGEAVADRVEDRDGDGQPDHWIYSSEGRVARERFDDDADGLPDRTIFYDSQTGQRERVEEDTNQDQRVDTWSYYDAGTLVRRRSDRDGDGAIDAWSFYRAERIVREELDTDGDGFRDRIDFYEAGHLARREEDANADGRVERVTRFDASGAPSQIDEDRDGDGRVDVRSHYSQGRLTRRELLTEVVAQGAEPATPSLRAP